MEQERRNHASSPQAKELEDESMVRNLYIAVDTLRVPRETFARIWEAWRDGHTDSLAALGVYSREEIERWWEQMIARIRDPRGDALWQVPVWTATTV